MGERDHARRDWLYCFGWSVSPNSPDPFRLMCGGVVFHVFHSFFNPSSLATNVLCSLACAVLQR